MKPHAGLACLSGRMILGPRDEVLWDQPRDVVIVIWASSILPIW
jgi:hypothetical protein